MCVCYCNCNMFVLIVGLWLEAAELIWASLIGFYALPQPDKKVWTHLYYRLSHLHYTLLASITHFAHQCVWSWTSVILLNLFSGHWNVPRAPGQHTDLHERQRLRCASGKASYWLGKTVWNVLNQFLPVLSPSSDVLRLSSRVFSERLAIVCCLRRGLPKWQLCSVSMDLCTSWPMWWVDSVSA